MGVRKVRIGESPPHSLDAEPDSRRMPHEYQDTVAPFNQGPSQQCCKGIFKDRSDGWRGYSAKPEHGHVEACPATNDRPSRCLRQIVIGYSADIPDSAREQSLDQFKIIASLPEIHVARINMTYAL